MPTSKLLKLKTDFKSLKYSQDRPDGGSSGQPFIKSPLPENATQAQLDFYQQVRSGIDNPIRVASQVINGVPTPIFAPVDKDRVNYLLKNTAKGRLFGKKERDLAFMNPKVEGAVQANLSGRLSQPIEYTRIYKEDNSNLLAQVARQGSGFHLDKFGVFAVTPYQSKYEYVVSRKGLSENRLKVLYDLKVLDKPFLADKDQTLGIIYALGVSRQRNFLFEYQGGPQSNGQYSFTTIQRASFTNTWKDVKLNGLSGSNFELYATGSDYLKKDRLVSLYSQSMTKDSLYHIAPGSPIRTIDLPTGVTQQDSSQMLIKRYSDTTTWSGLQYPTFTKTATTRVAPVSGSNLDPAISVEAYASEKLRNILFKVNNGKILPGGSIYNINIPDSARSQFSGSSTEIIIKRSLQDTFANGFLIMGVGTTRGTIAEINRPRVLTYAQLSAKLKEDNNREASGINTGLAINGDFRRDIIGYKGPKTEGYAGRSGEGYRANKKGTGNPGSKIINRKTYNTVGDKNNDLGVDKINALDVGASNAGDNTDMIKCIITAMEVQPDNSNKSIPMVFRAFLTNFQDNYSANYQDYQYIGRGEKFYTYNSAERKVNFDLTIAAQSRAEMKPLYRKLNYLVSQTYPAYAGFGTGGGSGFMRAPLVQITIGDYIYEQPGFINNINLTIVENSPWEVALDPLGIDKDIYQLPHAIKASMQFTPIHNFLPRRSFDAKNITPFVTPNTGQKANLFEI